MNFHDCLVFTTDLPDETTDDGDEILHYGGDNVAVVIGEIFREAGYLVGALDDQRERGWSFEVKRDGRSLWLLLQHMGDYLMLQIEDGRFFSLRPGQQRFKAVSLRLMVDALRSDGRFHDLLWRDESGERYGFTDPVVGAPGSEKRPTPAAWGW